MKTLFSSKNRKRQKQYTIQNKHTNSGCVKIFAILPFFFSQKKLEKLKGLFWIMAAIKAAERH